MCGRFYIDVEFDQLLKRYGFKSSPVSYEEREEIFPSEKSIAILSEDKLQMKQIKWGFLPSYAKRPIINARSETVFEKPLFSDSAIHRRCIIPASGYFEWQKKDKVKEKKRISHTEERIISLGGLYDEFRDKNGVVQLCFTILTREAVLEISHIHKRMPVLIQNENEDIWLDRNIQDKEVLKDIMIQYDGKLKVE